MRGEKHVGYEKYKKETDYRCSDCDSDYCGNGGICRNRRVSVKRGDIGGRNSISRRVKDEK